MATLVIGVSLLSYVGTAWLVHFSRAGQCFAAIALAAVSLAVTALALVRVQLECVVRICSESPYSLQELNQILFSEVWPTLSPNLASVAGEWAGWNREWLLQRILQKHKTGASRLWWLYPAKLFFCSDWFRVRQDIENRRSHKGPDSGNAAS